MTDDDIERGAAEDASGTPVTPTEVEAARTPPSRGPQDPDGADTDEGPDNTGGRERRGA
jgi:hypothetical protein